MREHLCDRLQRLQLAVGVELVVLGLIGRVGVAAFFDAVGIAGGAVVHALAFGVIVAVEHAQQPCLVVGEILVQTQRGGERDNGDHVRAGHFGLDVLLGGVYGALGLVGVH